MVLIAIWVVDQLISFMVFRPEGRFGDPIDIPWNVTLLQFVYGFLIVALVSYGLMQRGRFVWVAALVWQGIQGAFGFITLNDNGWGNATEGQIPLYGGTVPLLVAVISFVLLLLPTTQRWVRGR